MEVSGSFWGRITVVNRHGGVPNIGRPFGSGFDREHVVPASWVTTAGMLQRRAYVAKASEFH